MLQDLPGAEILFVGAGADELEVEQVGEGLGQEVAAGGERFQIEELLFDQAVNGCKRRSGRCERRAGCGGAGCRPSGWKSRWGDRDDHDRR